MKKEFIKLSGILCAITLVAALLLAGVNKVTAPKIAAAEKEAMQTAMKKILPEAESFEEIEKDVFVGKNADERVGVCVKVASNGYGGPIEMMVAFGADAKVRGIEILSHSETAGLGAKAAEPSFKKQFSGKDYLLNVVKTKTSSPEQITAITGATITSRAVASGVEKAFEIALAAITKEGQ